MTTTYRPIVTPAFMLADASDTAWGTQTSLNEATRDGIAPEFSFSVQAVHAARAEVLGELDKILRNPYEAWDRVYDYRNALRASLDDPEEGSA